jgi:hypothetical protein
MPVQHLLKQVELYRAKRDTRDVRPEWVTEFIDNAAELFDPYDEVARVGFDCQLAENGWEIAMFLGSVEIVGGREDGMSRHSSFQFDLKSVESQFRKIERVDFESSANAEAGQSPCARVVVEGIVGENPLRLTICSAAPSEAGPGFREFPNGRRDTV